MTAPGVASNPRADLYGLLAELLSFPNVQLEQAAGQGLVGGAVEHLLSHQPYDVVSDFGGLAPGELEQKELEAEFIRLFDVPDGPATPLYTGVYARQRREAMEELLRFYRHFGLTLAHTSHDLPDFVPTILEFLQFLSLKAAETSDQEARASLLLAHADVVERHLLPWAAQTTSRLATRRAHPFYADTVRLCLEVLGGELKWLRAQTG